MRTLADATLRRSLLERLDRLTPTSSRQWGTMTPPQMLRHLIDAFDGCTGKRSVSARNSAVGRTLIRALALYVPAPWPRGIRTLRELDAHREGSTPNEFEADRRELAAIIRAIGDAPSSMGWTRHPIFGRMSQWEWMRWAFLHVDHHLRQFGL